jgi:2-phosphosulfolactate phosphatase
VTDFEILQLLLGARAADGLTVVIDVFRAFSVACYVMGNGAARVIPVADLERAYALKQADGTRVLIGERHGRRPPGFDHGNSPTEIEDVDFRGRTVIQTTSAGTQGIEAASRADEIITGSFTNAPAIVRYIRARRPRRVSLVCMGHETVAESDEDTLCAELIRDTAQGAPVDFESIRERLRQSTAAERFFDPAKDWAPARDFDLCLALGRFDFILRYGVDADGTRALHRAEVPA